MFRTLLAEEKPLRQHSIAPNRSADDVSAPLPSRHPLLGLQRTIGNRVMGSLIQRCQKGEICAPCARGECTHHNEGEEANLLQDPGKSGVQTKLRINEPGDQYEQEADRVAEAVARMSEPDAISRTVLSKQVPISHIQRVCSDCPEERYPLSQRERILRAKEKSSHTPRNIPTLGAPIQAIRGRGQPLTGPVRTHFESRFGYDFSPVRIHNDQRAAEVAQALNAQAFTLGRDVVFGAGTYAPGTVEGRKLLAHELTHVIQQSKDHVDLPMLATSVSSTPATQIQRRVRFFVCNAADHTNVENAMSASMSVANMRAAVDTASDEAAAWARNAAGLLRMSPRSAAIQSAFHDAFGADPDWVPPWFGTLGASWVDFGDLVAQRLQRAAEILAGGWIQYYCWGSPTRCPECSSDPPTYRACSSYLGSYLICFGPGFWRSVAAGDTVDLTLTLLHEALHIYFSRTVAHTGRSSNAYCYRRFTAEANGLPLLPRDTARCPTA